ncbi:HAUS augmin-like complex subunit 6 isoform X1 [Notechis scutatus]|uniref:HAUS augmin-like complex subunit 6 isoform X1 n=2 Tax=Notechis scutatus TaxID=8663 RepID=A0A6J1V8B4_9SAUR|nr:HAUS augmin-like complex subunit 6 isoform X1 [Notechis scutatus]
MAERETNARKSFRGSSSRPSVGVGRSGGSGEMSNPFSPPAWEKEHFWLYLLALGFDPAVNAAAGKLSTHLRLGVNLFDKPNKDAFHIVAWFLFSKLDQSHCNEVFRFCYPPTDKKADSEFRKQCYEWLKRISDECGNSFPSVVASLFLSPGGPKFIHLMFHFARYVIMRHIKVDSLGAGIPYPEAVNSRSPDLNMAVAKYQVALNRFSQCLQKEDLMIQELQKKALFFTKQIRDLRYGNVDLDKRLQKMGKKVDSGQSNTTERIEKVRYLWATVMETLTFLQKEREVVDSVVKGHVDQYTLDGTSVSVSIPQPLLQKVEKEMYKFPVGNVYEEGKLNMLTIIQLLTKALELLLHERRQVDKKGFKIDLQDLEGNTRFQNETLLGLKSLRQKLKCNDHISVTQSIAEKQLEWQLKWKNRLGQSPFRLIKDPNPALDLLPAMSPLSFTPATEEAYKKSVFCQYPALIPDSIKNYVQADEFVTVGKTLGNEDYSTKTVTERTLKLATHSEKTSNVETPKRTDNSQFQILENKGRNSRRIESRKERQTRIPSSSAKKGDSLKKAQEQLAEEVADVVISDSPQNTGKDVGDLINALFSNPFLTRKQIPRTPENLITEIRSSWQKAIQTESPSGEAPHDSEATEQLSQETVPDFRRHLSSSLTLFMSPCISDTAEFPFLDVEPPGSSQQGITDELLNHQEAFRPLDKIICKKELSLAAPDRVEHPESVFQALNRSVHEVSCGSGNHTGSETLSHSVGQNSTMCATLLREASQAISRTGLDSHDVMQLGILQETFPEEGESISLNSLHDLDLDDSGEDNSRDRKSATDYLSGNECKLDFQSIFSRYEALKKSLLDHPPDPGKRMPRCRSAFNLSPTSLETKDVLSPLGKPYASDAELAKKSSQPSHLERRNSLSPLMAICPLWLREKRDMQVGGDVFNKRKEK